MYLGQCLQLQSDQSDSNKVSWTHVSLVLESTINDFSRLLSHSGNAS